MTSFDIKIQCDEYGIDDRDAIMAEIARDEMWQEFWQEIRNQAMHEECLEMMMMENP